MEPLPYMSKRFMLERFLGLTEDEIKENEEMWQEERDQPEMQTNSGQDLRSVGVTPGGLESDIETGADMAGMEPGTPGTPGVDAAAGPGGPGGVVPASATGATPTA
jgi:hypothetical protein